MEKEIIVNSGMGNFINPPGDAEHFFSLKVGNSSHMSLRSALEDDEVSDKTKGKIRALLEAHRGELTEEWEHSCYNYFRDCYSPDGIDRSVDKRISSKECNNPEHHLAYMFIKSFFPDYQPNLELIAHNGDKGSWSRKR